MNSGNHVMQIGDLGIWMYSYLGGIQPDPNDPGFRRTIIHPYIPTALRSVRVSHRSMYGKIVSDWRREADSLSLHVTIPPNATALIYVPSHNDAPVTESAVEGMHGPKARFVRREAGASVFEVGSGSYSFHTQY